MRCHVIFKYIKKQDRENGYSLGFFLSLDWILLAVEGGRIRGVFTLPLLHISCDYLFWSFLIGLYCERRYNNIKIS